MGLFKKKEPVKVRVPRDNFSLDEIIAHLSEQSDHAFYPKSDDVQSLLVQLGSSFKIHHGNHSENIAGTNHYRVVYLVAALLLKKMK